MLGVRRKAISMRLCFVLLCFVLFKNGFCKLRGISSHINDNSIKYSEKFSSLTIPIMVHFDKQLTLKVRKAYQNKTRIAVKTISRNLLKKVEKLFQRPSLNQKIKLKLIEARILKRRMVNDTNVSVYLKRYCRWQGERKKQRKKTYFSVLLTGLDVYYLNRGRKMWSSTGRSYNGGVCSTYHSCAVLEWKPKNIVFLLAHEIAHSLGVSHDTSSCADKKYIMANKYNPLRHPDSWSACSRQGLQKFLTSKHSRCLIKGV